MACMVVVLLAYQACNFQIERVGERFSITAVMQGSMAVRTQRYRIRGSVRPTVCKPADMVDFKEGQAIYILKGSCGITGFAAASGRVEDPSLHSWVSEMLSDSH